MKRRVERNLVLVALATLLVAAGLDAPGHSAVAWIGGLDKSALRTPSRLATWASTSPRATGRVHQAPGHVGQMLPSPSLGPPLLSVS